MKKISNQFVVNTVEDGESAPYYFQEWFAWSNDATTASVTTEPTIDGVWATSIPAQGSYAYLWRKSIRNVWDANSRTYTQETAQYFRMSGENGTNINVKGTINYAYNNSGGFPPPSSSITGYKAVAKEDNRIWICQQVAQNAYDWVPNGGTASDGFSYTIVQGNFNGNYQSTSNLTGHLVMWSTEAEDWVDLGLFKGEAGVTYYTHIAWATSVTLSQSELPIPSGQTNRPNALAANISGFSITPLSGVSYAWMGYLIDTNSSDSQVKQNYTWQMNKGEKGDKGDDAQYIYLKGTALNKEGSEPKVPCEVSVKGGNNLATTDRGLNLVTLNRTTLALVERINYDTYGEAVGEAGKTGITDLVTKLNSINNDVFVCLVSYDAIGWNSTLISVLQDFGMSELQYTASWRYPFMFIGYKGLGYGNGITRMRDAVEHSSEAVEMSVYIANGALTMKDGERGEMGRFFYFGGVFNSADATQTFIVNDAQAPYFEHTENGQKRYHVFNYDTNGTYTMAQMWAVSDNWNNKPWEAMTNDFKYIITEALFSSYAHLGSWIFNGDYMLSEKDGSGNPRGQQAYNGMDNNQLTSGFIPSVAFDASNGRASFSGDKVRFNPNGGGWLADGNISWGSGGKVSLKGGFDATNGTIDDITIGMTTRHHFTLTSDNFGAKMAGLDNNNNELFRLFFSNGVGASIRITDANNTETATMSKSYVGISRQTGEQGGYFLGFKSALKDSEVSFSSSTYPNNDLVQRYFRVGISTEQASLRAYDNSGNSIWPEYSHLLDPTYLSKGLVQVMSLGSLKAIFDGTYYSDRLSKLSVLIIRNNAY